MAALLVLYLTARLLRDIIVVNLYYTYCEHNNVKFSWLKVLAMLTGFDDDWEVDYSM